VNEQPWATKVANAVKFWEDCFSAKKSAAKQILAVIKGHGIVLCQLQYRIKTLSSGDFVILILCAFDRFVQSSSRAVLVTDCPIAHQLVDRTTVGWSHCSRSIVHASCLQADTFWVYWAIVALLTHCCTGELSTSSAVHSADRTNRSNAYNTNTGSNPYANPNPKPNPCYWTLRLPDVVWHKEKR